MNENEDIHILDVAGRPDPQDKHVHEALFGMSLTSELTKSDKGLYHAQINPAYGDDKRMSAESWLQAADMLGQELGFAEQRRVVVLHTKKDRTHAHVVWERYDLEKGRMISDSFSRLAQDRVRKEMERVFEQQQTPHRNVNRPEMKEALSALWQKSISGHEFLKEAGKAGYVIAKGVKRRPFMIVDKTGRSFDLVRQLDGIKTKEVREKLKSEKLLPEKEAITAAKAQQNAIVFDVAQEQTMDKIAGFQKQRQNAEEVKTSTLVQDFASSKEIFTRPDEAALSKERQKTAAGKFAGSADDILQKPKTEGEQTGHEKEKKVTIAQAFADNSPEVLAAQAEKERKRQSMLLQLKEQQERQEKNRGKGREPD